MLFICFDFVPWHKAAFVQLTNKKNEIGKNLGHGPEKPQVPQNRTKLQLYKTFDRFTRPLKNDVKRVDKYIIGKWSRCCYRLTRN